MDSTNDWANKEREVDQWLESALSEYSKAEPRTGLESRVLVNLQAERNRMASRRRWWWALGTVTALAAIVVAVWIGESGRERKPTIAGGTSTTHRGESRAPIQARPAPQIAHPVSGYPASQVAKRRRVDHAVRGLGAATTPKLAQFPSPQPLSEQEQFLMGYVTQYPEGAALVARAQTEALRQELLEEVTEAAKGSGQ